MEVPDKQLAVNYTMVEWELRYSLSKHIMQKYKYIFPYPRSLALSYPILTFHFLKWLNSKDEQYLTPENFNRSFYILFILSEIEVMRVKNYHSWIHGWSCLCRVSHLLFVLTSLFSSIYISCNFISIIIFLVRISLQSNLLTNL